MKLPSLQHLLQTAKASFLRFPLSIISSALAVCIAIVLIESHRDYTNIFPAINAMLVLALGIPLFFSSTILSENKNTSFKLSAHAIVTVLLIALYFYLPNSKQTLNTSIPYVRYGLYNVIAHLVVAVVPFVKPGHLNGFWNYNKGLFLRFLAALLYSGILYLGIVLAMGALYLLFDVDFEEERYGQLFVLIAGFFNTWFFVSGIPKNIKQLDTINEYPIALKRLTQYVLLPLLTLYLLIVYVYGIKILAFADWPRGIVSYLISGISVFGILSILLIYPYGKQKENAWIAKFSKIYYLLLFPLIALLFIAISMRISDYGITINRYAIVLLGIWLTVISSYFAINGKNIKLIPMVLAGFLAAMSFGPWGMYSVSEASQINRLESILTQNGILKNGKVVNETIWVTDSLPELHHEGQLKNNEILPDSLHNEVYSIIDYLDDHHGFSSIQTWFTQNVDSIMRVRKDSFKYANEDHFYMNSLGLQSNRKYHGNSNLKRKRFYRFSKTTSDVKNVKDYDYYFTRKSLESNVRNIKGSEQVWRSQNFHSTQSGLLYLKYDFNNKNILITDFNKDTLLFPFNPSPSINELTMHEKYSTVTWKHGGLELLDSSANIKAKIVISYFEIFGRPDSNYLDEFKYELYIKDLQN